MDIEFKIDEFSGPLDLLLHLIKINKMNILDIEIEKITSQYLEYLDKMEEMNLEVTSNYLVMASELIYIKSRMLLPNAKKEETVELEEDPRADLVNRLIEYKSYKEITNILKEKELERGNVYTKTPEDIKKYLKENEKVFNDNVSIDDLTEAFKKFLMRKNAEKPLKTKVTEKEIKVSDRKVRIKNILKSNRKIKFSSLFEDYSKEYVVATFLAILELAKEGEISIVQTDSFGDIECEAIK